MSGRASRYAETSDVTAQQQNADNAYGGLKRATTVTTIVNDLKFMSWAPSAYNLTSYIATYGLTSDAQIKLINCAYYSTIRAGHFITIDGEKFKILGASGVKGASGAFEALTMVAYKVAA
jgi:hypothetical protein